MIKQARAAGCGDAGRGAREEGLGGFLKSRVQSVQHATDVVIKLQKRACCFVDQQVRALGKQHKRFEFGS